MPRLLWTRRRKSSGAMFLKKWMLRGRAVSRNARGSLARPVRAGVHVRPEPERRDPQPATAFSVSVTWRRASSYSVVTGAETTR